MSFKKVIIFALLRIPLDTLPLQGLQMSADPVAKWEEFLRTRYWDDLLELADSYPDERSLKISSPDIDRFDPDFAEELLENRGDPGSGTGGNAGAGPAHGRLHGPRTRAHY